MRLLIIDNLISDLKKSRFPLGEYFELNGITVFYACPTHDNETNVFDLPLKRDSLSPKDLIRSVLILSRIEKQCKIDRVMSFRLVPNIVNYFSSFFSKRKRTIVITGLGYLFVSNVGCFRKRLLRSVIKWFYRIASRRVTVISQNIDDLVEVGLPKPHLVVNGSGLKDDFTSRRSPEKLSLLFVGRLLKSKGIIEAYNLFLRLKEINKSVNLIIAGEIDYKNPDSISEEELNVIVRTEKVDYLGFIEDLTPVFQRTNVLIFPSIYREGVPRVIIEALKFGLTIITYNLPGCKETVTSNGLLLNPGDILSDKVVNYLLHLDKARLAENVLESRRLFLEKFCSDIVYNRYYEIINN